MSVQHHGIDDENNLTSKWAATRTLSAAASNIFKRTSSCATAHDVMFEVGARVTSWHKTI